MIRFRIPSFSDLFVVAALFAIAATIWILDPKARHSSPYKDGVDD